MKSYLFLILGMMAVTYLPRLIPLVIMTDRPLNPLLKRFLLYIPYTALTALITQGVLQAAPEMRLATIAGIGVAGMCSWFKGGLVVSVLVSITVVFIFLQLKIPIWIF